MSIVLRMSMAIFLALAILLALEAVHARAACTADIHGIHTSWEKRPTPEQVIRLKAILSHVVEWSHEFLADHRQALYDSYVEMCRLAKYKPVSIEKWEKYVFSHGLPQRICFLQEGIRQPLYGGRLANGECHSDGAVYHIDMCWNSHADRTLLHEIGHGIFRDAVDHGSGDRLTWTNHTQASLMMAWESFCLSKLESKDEPRK